MGCVYARVECVFVCVCMYITVLFISITSHQRTHLLTTNTPPPSTLESPSKFKMKLLVLLTTLATLSSASILTGLVSSNNLPRAVSTAPLYSPYPPSRFHFFSSLFPSQATALRTNTPQSRRNAAAAVFSRASARSTTAEIWIVVANG